MFYLRIAYSNGQITNHTLGAGYQVVSREHPERWNRYAGMHANDTRVVAVVSGRQKDESDPSRTVAIPIMEHNSYYVMTGNGNTFERIWSAVSEPDPEKVPLVNDLGVKAGN